MAKPTQLWPGERMRTFFRSIFKGESGVSDELADRLADVCERHINRMLVWNGEPAARIKANQSQESALDSPNGRQDGNEVAAGTDETRPRKARKSREAPPRAETLDELSETEAGAPWSMEHLDEPICDTDTVGHGVVEVSGNVPPDQPAKSEPTFDPFAFSAIVILARSGADALMARLKEINKAEHLRQLADAQHLGIDLKVRRAAELRKAIVRGAKQRLADRRAAAS